MLDLSGNKFDDDGWMHLAKCITKVEKLILRVCGTGAREMEILSQGIMQRDHPVITALICLIFLCG